MQTSKAKSALTADIARAFLYPWILSPGVRRTTLRTVGAAKADGSVRKRASLPRKAEQSGGEGRDVVAKDGANMQ